MAIQRDDFHIETIGTVMRCVERWLATSIGASTHGNLRLSLKKPQPHGDLGWLSVEQVILLIESLPINGATCLWTGLYMCGMREGVYMLAAIG